MFVLAMGKMGARELNYSSDIDLIVLFDETRHDPGDYADLRRGFIRVTQRLVKLLSEITAEGYVFRTDLRLRPDPSVDAGLHRHRARRALLREPRPHLGARRLHQGPPLRRRHRRRRGLPRRACGPSSGAATSTSPRSRTPRTCACASAPTRAWPARSASPATTSSSASGGIREIEFFTQTRQLIVGGRDPDLRQRATLDALAALADQGLGRAATPPRRWPRPTSPTATLEHRLQMLDDAQTQRMPDDPDGARPARRLLRRSRSPRPSRPTLRARLDRGRRR